MKQIFLLICINFISLTAANADHFNSTNLMTECARQSDINSVCYTYVAAYRDLLGFFVSADNTDREKVFCLLRVPTNEITRKLQNYSLRESDNWQIARFLIDEFCN